jgi:HD-GYP domain-containing protein (c-di-GMP phosphodiesterase class II)
VRLLSLTNRLIVPDAGIGDRRRPHDEDAWEILEGYAREISHCDISARQRRLALEAVRDSLNADVVYWYPGSTNDPVELLSVHDLPTDWCRAFARKLLEETPGLDGRLLRSVLPSALRTPPCSPHSAALVRVSRSKGNWLVALSLDPRRALNITDLRIMTLIRQILVNQRRRCDLTSRMSETMNWLVQCLASSIDAHFPPAKGHSERVAKIAVEMGKRMHLPTAVLSDLYFAGLVHDIGITSVEQGLLLKPAKLTSEEFAKVKAYPLIGDSMLASIKQLDHLRPAVRHHHERYDGRGYPDGLSGDNIPLMARILAVADAFDAMLSPRPYRPPLAGASVDAILSQGAGQQWDPAVIEHFLSCSPELHGLCATVSQPVGANVEFAVAAWNVDSSRNFAVSKTHGHGARPPDTFKELGPP